MSEGFKPPEAVWLLGEPATADTKRSLPVMLLLGVLVGALVLGGGFLLSPFGGIADEKQQDVAVGECLSIEFDVNGDVIPGWEIVECGGAWANSRVDSTGECGNGPNHSINAVVQDQVLCLQRVVRVGQCSPLTAPVLDPETRMNVSRVVPCDAPETANYPYLARVVSVLLSSGQKCPEGTGQWMMSPDDVKFCAAQVF